MNEKDKIIRVRKKRRNRIIISSASQASQASQSQSSWYYANVKTRIIMIITILSILSNNNVSVHSQIIGIGDVVDESTCYNDLYEADTDKNKWLNKTEFVTFVNLQSDNYFDQVNRFRQLPDEIQRVFTKSASCPNCIGDCCNDNQKGIDVSGTGPNDRPSTLQSVKLFTVCSNAFANIDSVMTPSPTPKPSQSPTINPSFTPTHTNIPTTAPSSYVLATQPPVNQEPRISTTTLSPSAITFIALGAAVAGVLTIGLLYRHNNKRKRRQEIVMMNSPPPKPPQHAHPPQSNTLGASTPHYGPSGSKVAPVAAFPVLSDEECSSKHSMDDLENQSQTSSSNAGSSGWSSSAGVSSMNTASVDSHEIDILLGGTLATIGLHSGSASRLASNTSALQYVPEGVETETYDLDSLTEGSTDQLLISNSPSVTRADLDNAIEAGDWAAVGATAALLASVSGSLSSPTKSAKSDISSKDDSHLSSIDAARASELDRMVDNGDWEGVVLAAAKFEANQDDQESSSSDNILQKATTTSSGKSATDLSILSNSASSLNSKSAGSGVDSTSALSNSQKQAEIQSEVEALVRRVVPDEIDNVDEMMTQFKGREDELIETLRTMQERSIAQRARTAMHKSAKREARKSRLDNNKTNLGFPPRPPNIAATQQTANATQNANNSITTADVLTATAAIANKKSSQDCISASSEPSEKPVPSSQSSVNSKASKDVTRSALELAIEAGDWEAVGEAAAMMSDASVTTASESSALQLQQLVDAEYDNSTDYETCTSKGTTDSIKSVNLQRAAELDRLIDQGDWSGVVSAASRFSSMDAMAKRKHEENNNDKQQPSWKITSSGASISSGESDTFHSSHTQQGSLTSKEKALQEEHDALAQAEIWMAIAAQSKQGTEAKGASDAADWAISRSLVALNNAELKVPSSSPNANKDALMNNPHEKDDTTNEYNNSKSVTSEEDKSV